MPDLCRLPANASEAKKRIAAFLKQRLKIPDVALIILFSIRPWAWALHLAWLFGSSLAAKFEVRLHKGSCCLGVVVAENLCSYTNTDPVTAWHCMHTSRYALRPLARLIFCISMDCLRIPYEGHARLFPYKVNR